MPGQLTSSPIWHDTSRVKSVAPTALVLPLTFQSIRRTRRLLTPTPEGLEHAFTIGTWQEFRLLNMEMCYLDQQ